MRVSDLKSRLNELGVRPSAYTLEGGRADNRYGIERHGRTWYVYYSERGEITWERLCTTAEEACELFVQRIGNDPTTKQP